MSEQILFSKYQVVSILSKSEYSTVYLVTHIKLQSYRIIKQIYKASPYYEQLIGEAYIMKSLTHSSIPQIYDIEENEESFYIVEQYVQGDSLKKICQYEKLYERLIIKFALQICDVIQYLHSREEKILHLDLKPDNIIVSGEQLFLVDFGSSNYHTEKLHTNSGFGTRWFAAPEQYIKSHIDERADIYGIGMLLYYMIMGKQYSYRKGRNIDFCNNCSKDLKRIVNGCLKLQSIQRYATVREVRERLLKLNKETNRKQPKQCITIAIAGAQHRIGVTYFSLQYAGFLKRNRYSCQYIECNESLALSAFSRRLGYSSYQDSGYIINNIPCATFNNKDEKLFVNNQVQYTICDYGKLTNENMTDFLKSDYCFVVMGAKEWELDASEECLRICSQRQDVTYLFNFLSAQEFGYVIKNMKGLKSYRIPYEPQLFIKDSKSSMYLFLREFYKDFIRLHKQLTP